jgi:hypothetical protein
MKARKKVAAVALLTSFSLLAAACGGDDEEATPATTAAPAPETTAEAAPETTAEAAPETTAEVAPETTAEAPSEDAICPTNVVVQTDWWPELEHGGTYQLIGPDGTADAENFIYSGPIQEQYQVGGIETVEIRAGGDATGFVPNQSLLASDDDIMFAYINISDVMKGAAEVPMVAVAKTLDLDPQMIMWDPEQNPVATPEDIAASGAQVLHFDGVAYIDYMIAQGYMTADQSNPSYGGAPDQWVAEGGNFFQQGFATNEVYKYENEIEWKDGAPAPVDYYTVGELGIPNYPAAMTIRGDRLEEFTPCLEVLVPMLSQAWVDYLADPTPITDALISINETYNTYWTLSEGLNTRGLEILEEEGIGNNSPDGTYCSFDADRIQELADIFGPIYEADGTELIDDLTSVVDNSFCEGAPGRE